jgi:mRNA-degrading endonuclease RelE of RelBE toxin-antitoxin system
MSFEIIAVPNFQRELKKLHKKDPSIKEDFAKLVESLKQEPDQGTSLGQDCFKIRMSIASKGRGKSGGSRVKTCVKVIKKSIYLLSIFDKSEKETISSKELSELIKNL